jgi:hypothetical protein
MFSPPMLHPKADIIVSADPKRAAVKAASRGKCETSLRQIRELFGCQGNLGCSEAPKKRMGYCVNTANSDFFKLAQMY